VACIGVLLIAVNALNVRRYGEFEFWLTWVKIVMIVGFIIILGILLPLQAFNGPSLLGTDTIANRPILCPGPNANPPCVPTPGFNCSLPPKPLFYHPPLHFRSDFLIVWRDDAFRDFLGKTGAWGRFLGFWYCCTTSIFSYLGLEIIGIAAVETERQRENVPKVSRQATQRIIIYYVLASVVLGLNVYANDPILEAQYTQSNSTVPNISPFVLMILRAGLGNHFANLMNVIVLLAALTAANANLYLSVHKPLLLG